LRALSRFCCVYPTCNFFLEYDPRFSVAPSQNVTGTPRPRPRRPAHLHFPNKTIQRCAQFPNNSRTIAVAAKSFPAPVSNVAVSVISVRCLLRQPRCALEAGPSEAHAISFVHTPTPHLHWKGYTFSHIFFVSALTKGIMGNNSLG